MDFLQHEVGVAAFFGGRDIPLDLVHNGQPRFAVERRDAQALPVNLGHVPVIEEYDAPGVRQDGGYVGRDKVFAFGHADDEWIVHAGGDNRPGFFRGDGGNCVTAPDLPQRLAHRRDKAAVVVGAYEVTEHFGVGLRDEATSTPLQFPAEFVVVFDYAVVNNGDSSLQGEVWMGVLARRHSVRGPARMAQAGRARKFRILDNARQFMQLARVLLES